MGGWKEHIIVGLFSSIVVFALLFYFIGEDLLDVKLFLSVPLIIIYYLLPDIDSPGSKISRIIYGIIISSVAICGFIYFITDNSFFIVLMFIIALFGVSMLFLGHRGITHSLVCAVIFSLPIIFISKWVAIFCFIGYLSHLVIDGEIKLI